MNPTLEFFDFQAPDYDAFQRTCVPRYEEMIRMAATFAARSLSATKSPRVLELGCGTGNTTLELAKMLLETSIGLMAKVAEATGNTHAEAYLIDHLRIMASSNHGFMSCDFNLDEWIEQVEAAEAKGQQ